MKIGIHQVGYIPWLGFFDQIYRCDKYVLHIDTQFDRHSWRNRNRIRTNTGWAWLTVPVYTKRRFGQSLKDVEIDNHGNWPKKHWLAIKQNYSSSIFYSKYCYFFEDILIGKKWKFLIDLELSIIEWCLRQLGISTEIVISSQLTSRATKTEGVIQICKELGANAYLSSSAGRNYLNESRLAEENIQLEYQEYLHPVYPQVYLGFIPYLSIVDLLFNMGDASLGVVSKHGYENHCPSSKY